LGSPIEPPSGFGGTLGTGLGTSTIVVAMGSMYPTGAPGPASSGVLMTINVSGPCFISITPENTYRGGVVLEDATSAEVQSYGAYITPEPVSICLFGAGILLLRRKRAG
jgi:hypothetical protein